MIVVCETRTYMTVRDLGRSCRMGCETGKHLLLEGYQLNGYTNANAKGRGSAEA
jgi:hypothetical protein